MSANGNVNGKGPLAAAGTDPGLARENNEDRFLLDPERGIYAVIDGVGGESGGEVAAQTALEVLRARLSRRTTDVSRLIREAIALANKQIWERAQAETGLAGMSCVLTVAVIDDGQVTIGHVGDSRLYLLRRGEIKKITRDHSPVGMREDAGEISESEAMHHPRRNEIFRDVGSAPHEPDEEGFIEIHQIPFAADNALLLCSDGLSDLVPSAQILDKVETNPGDPDAAVRELIAAANEAGGKDNITVVLVEGERFAAGARSLKGPTPASMGSTQVSIGSIRGAGSVRAGAGERFLEILGSRPALLLYGGIAVLGLLFLLRGPLRPYIAPYAAKIGLDRLLAGTPKVTVLRVDPKGEEGFKTIAEALDQAQPGQTIEVAPGDYPGPIELKDGVSLVSPTPRGAVVRLPKGVADPAVYGEEVHSLRFAGFRILGTAEAPLDIGLRLADSSVDVEDVEVSGAATAGLEIAGSDRSVLRYCFVHDNPGTGVIVRDQAAPSLHQNLILRNGIDPRDPAPGVEIRDEARPQLVQNRIEGNGAAAVWVPAAERIDEIFGFNAFGNLPREKAVQVEPPPAAPAASLAPAPAPPPAARSQVKPPARPRRNR